VQLAPGFSWIRVLFLKQVHLQKSGAAVFRGDLSVGIIAEKEKGGKGEGCCRDLRFVVHLHSPAAKAAKTPSMKNRNCGTNMS